MKKYVKFLIVCLIALAVLSSVSLLRDYVHLHRNILRLHVVAASDSGEDQDVKLMVRDRVLSYLNEQIPVGTDKDTAQDLIAERLHQIQIVANDVLQEEGFAHTAEVTLTKEAFPERAYETFSLPAGVYDSLRIRIGNAEGRNWWCVIFPSLCLSATSEGFESTAVSAGFSGSLTGTISRQEGYEIRFFFLDCLGRIENFFHNR